MLYSYNQKVIKPASHNKHVKFVKMLFFVNELIFLVKLDELEAKRRFQQVLKA